MLKYDCSDDNSIFWCKVVGEIEDIVKTGLWVGDCFIYTNSGKKYLWINNILLIVMPCMIPKSFSFFPVNRLNYYVGGEIVTIAHLDG